MNAHEFEIDRILRAGQGVIARRQHPHLARALQTSVDRGRLVPLLPGVYAASDRRHDLGTRLRAAMLWDPDAVVAGRAAAKVTFWPDLDVTRIELCVNTRKGHHRTWSMARRRIPPELVMEVEGVRCTAPALTALDLSLTELGGNAIDTALRTGAATLDQLHEALTRTPGRPGTSDLRVLLLDSKDEPWSEAERDLHRLLHGAGITGWEGNLPVRLPSGRYRIDVAFPGLKLAVEVDGWEFHNTREAFERDRPRQNELVLAGWVVLRFTAAMIADRPEQVLSDIRAALAILAAR